ncbi:hypothetical protein OH76DRAFT_1408958 [Lentinus brumalis]|uniref:Uncharacterized protein n=1 Tax=Lentinus brumalis TaxID=2498619 RepID=A0A371CW82_9APHY|nr:hypothetical protein OH76DRAFT_1408958 [Polyporus brumalis]
MSSTSPSRQQHPKQHRDDMYADEGDDLLADYFEKSALAVRHMFARFERNVARPLIHYLLISFRERPATSTFVATFVVLSALPVLSFIGFSIFVFAAFAFVALAAAFLSASSVVSVVALLLACILVLILVVASALTIGALSTFVVVRFFLRARQDGPHIALSELADGARTQYALARGRQPGPRPGPESNSESQSVKKEDPDSESDSVVVVRSGSGEGQKETQNLGPGFGTFGPGVPMDAPA